MMGLHVNIRTAYLFQLLFGVALSLAMGPLFDVYLFKLGGEGDGNKLVGAVESVSGLVALALVLPVGFIVDHWDRLRLLRFAALVGLVSSVVGSWAIVSDSIPAWYLTMILVGIYSELSMSVVYALFADSVTPDERPKATATMAIFSNVASAAGPGLSLIAFLFIGDKWEGPQLRAILLAGMALVNPLACVSLLRFQKAPFAAPDVGLDLDDGEEPVVETSEFLKLRGAKFVPYVVASTDLVTMIGAGMTIKYFNLYWKIDWGMEPSQVLAISVVQPLTIALCIKLLERPAKLVGRAQAALACTACGIVAFVVLAEVKSLPIALLAYFLRSGLANAAYPYNKSIMYDFTPSSQRGRWNAIETLCGSVWSGSAFIGGYMADRYDYRFTFLVTAGIYAVGCTLYSPLLCLVPGPRAGDEEKQASLLEAMASPPRRRLSSSARAEILASPNGLRIAATPSLVVHAMSQH